MSISKQDIQYGLLVSLPTLIITTIGLIAIKKLYYNNFSQGYKLLFFLACASACLITPANMYATHKIMEHKSQAQKDKNIESTITPVERTPTVQSTPAPPTLTAHSIIPPPPPAPPPVATHPSAPVRTTGRGDFLAQIKQGTTLKPNKDRKLPPPVTPPINNDTNNDLITQLRDSLAKRFHNTDNATANNSDLNNSCKPDDDDWDTEITTSPTVKNNATYRAHTPITPATSSKNGNCNKVMTKSSPYDSQTSSSYSSDETKDADSTKANNNLGTTISTEVDGTQASIVQDRIKHFGGKT